MTCSKRMPSLSTISILTGRCWCCGESQTSVDGVARLALLDEMQRLQRDRARVSISTSGVTR